MSESLKELSERATQGVWQEPVWSTDIRSGRVTVGMTSPQGDGNGLNDRAFIVALVNAYRNGEMCRASDTEHYMRLARERQDAIASAEDAAHAKGRAEAIGEAVRKDMALAHEKSSLTPLLPHLKGSADA